MHSKKALDDIWLKYYSFSESFLLIPSLDKNPKVITNNSETIWLINFSPSIHIH